jgi:enoyl-CoA hydratase/carnithine racemase
MEEQLTAAGGEIAAEVRAGVATVTLNRPAALNALTLGMLKGLASWLDAWEKDDGVRIVTLQGAGEKAFCAGGDIRALYASFRSGTKAHHEFFEVEYALDYRIHTYPKTIVAVIDGVVMGGGMGISQGARLRVVGDRTRMAMPETAIGLFPDVGGSYFLSRLPGALGIYLGLVGPTLRAADALYCGLADVYLAPQAMAHLGEELRTAAASARPEEVAREALMPRGAAALDGSELERLREAIDRHFAHPSVPQIVSSLEREEWPEWREWAAKTLEALSKRSPTMLAVTLEQLRRGAKMSLADCFRMELNLIHGCFEQGDFIEGIRALIVEKDNRPHWRPARLEQVQRPAVDAFFMPRWPAARHPLASLH